MKKITPILLASFLLISAVVQSQEKKLERADKEFNNFAFIDARDAYLKVAEDGFMSEDLLMRLGDSYYFTADYVNASRWYASLYEFSQNTTPEYLYRYAQSLKSSGQYAASDKVMEEFYQSNGTDKRGFLFANERNYLEEIEAQSGRFKLINVPFNSSLSDFAPSYYKGNLVFASNRLNGRNKAGRVHDWNEQPFLDIYQIPLATPDNYYVKSFDNKVNTKYHESTAAFSKDGQTMYFTRNNYTNGDYKKDSNGTNKLKMYKGKLNAKGKWDISEVPFNSDEYSVAHPALSEDDKTLYFASDMPGGKGMSDLYKVSIEGDGFGTPESLGDNINTEFRETFPFVTLDKLYFASDGHPGLGGLDIFVAEMQNENFGDVFNIGRPVNSKKDDFTFIVNDKSGIGYFASNRDGGEGDDDIYSFEKVEDIISSCSQMVTGVVIDKDTKEPIPLAKVVLMDPANRVIDQLIANENGAFSFPLDCSKPYCVRGSKIEYGFDEECFTTGPELKLELSLNLELESLAQDKPKIGDDLNFILDLLPIYFDLDKDFIRADAQVELQKVIAFMKVYPTTKIDVRSHTDSRAPDDYNMDLSSRRNANTIDYIVTRGGIDRSRLTGRGYGETQLTNRCSNGVPCDEGLHQLNRRSEFIIVSK